MFYRLGLEDLPDEDASSLQRSIALWCDETGKQFRPSVPQIRQLWADLRSGGQEGVTEVLSRVIELMQKYGPYGRTVRTSVKVRALASEYDQHPDIYSNETWRGPVDAGEWNGREKSGKKVDVVECERRHCRFELGAPEELTKLPGAARRVIDAMGGWVVICTEDTPVAVFRAQFERLYKATAQGQSQADLRQLRLEHQATLQLMATEDNPDLDDGAALVRVGSVIRTPKK